jgi:hypothetical protein
MATWEIMAHQIVLPVSAEAPIALPAGWEPIGTLARQGNNAVVLCRRQADDPTPPSGAPVLDSITPSSLASGGTPATVDAVGSGFDTSSVIQADGVPRATFYIDATHLQYTARPDLQAPGPVQITVAGDNGTSNALTFTYT